MDLHLTPVGQNMNKLTGVRIILKKIREALRAGEGEFLNLSVGNPTKLPEVIALWEEATKELLGSENFGNVIAQYGMTAGYEPFIDAMVEDLNAQYDLGLTYKNVLVTGGAQQLLFIAANSLCGRMEDGSLRHLVLPLCPEYTGYGGITADPGTVITCKPTLDIDEEAHRYKYHPDLEHVPIDENTGAVLFGRPSNPTGNVMSDEEAGRICQMAKDAGAVVLADSAYGYPYPGMVYTDAQPIFGDHIAHIMSLSKVGLPGERIGVTIAHEDIIDTFTSFLANLGMHSSRFGQALAAHALRSGALKRICQDVIVPHYQEKFSIVQEAFDTHMPDVPWFIHRAEGGMFVWLWLRDCPIDDWALTDRLMEQKVLVIPGSPFFPGLSEDWQHSKECLRISLSISPEEIVEGVKRISEVVGEVYANN